MKKCEPIDPAIMQLIRDYYTYHGDSNVRYAGTIHTPQGGKLYLTRFDNKGQIPYSGIVMICTGYRGDYATELWSAPRKRENEMIAFALEEGDDDAPVD